jgi:hypothetical protein
VLDAAGVSTCIVSLYRPESLNAEASIFNINIRTPAKSRLRDQQGPLVWKCFLPAAMSTLLLTMWPYTHTLVDELISLLRLP